MAKDRSQDQTAICISLPKDLLKKIDARASSFDLPRSQYIAILTRNDIAEGGPLVIPTADAPQPVHRLELNAFALDFLSFAVSTLADYQNNPNQDRTLDVPEKLAESQLWHFFLEQRDEILRQKWIESQKARFDIGAERACRDWLQKHQSLWADEPDAAPA